MKMKRRMIEEYDAGLGVAEEATPTSPSSRSLISLIFVTINLVVDMLYGYINPTIRYK